MLFDEERLIALLPLIAERRFKMVKTRFSQLCNNC